MFKERNKDIIKIYNNALENLQSMMNTDFQPFCGYGLDKKQYQQGVNKGVKYFYEQLNISITDINNLKRTKIIKTKKQFKFINRVLYTLYMLESDIKDSYEGWEKYRETEHQKLAGYYAGQFFQSRVFISEALQGVTNSHLYYNEEG